MSYQNASRGKASSFIVDMLETRIKRCKVLARFLYIASPQQGDLRLSDPPSGQGAGGGARTRDRRVPADLRADSLATVQKASPFVGVGNSSGRAVGYQVGGSTFESQSGRSQFYIAPLCPPSTILNE
ncbi:hypothetical protein PoB_004519700 [Plakobranchus ocellatus]|uniref:Uncharacterized protein n=1 Tax=Plakobranchus ocellatus TaxID=259542 RepID=A0AAV4BIB7_9GAST|nr:hypothetical protein PoB_004519700 [Plakobranchus ocellatus]